MVVEEVLIDPQSRRVEWIPASARPGLHVALASLTKEAVVIHSAGYSVGSGPGRVYVPAQFHVFLILSRDADGRHRLQHVISHPVRFSPVRPSSGLPLFWRPYPDPDAQPRNGAKPT